MTPFFGSRKFVAWFLILASVASSFVVILSSGGLRDKASDSTVVAESATSTTPSNAFRESASGIASGSQYLDGSVASSSVSLTVTEEFAMAAADQILSDGKTTPTEEETAVTVENLVNQLVADKTGMVTSEVYARTTAAVEPSQTTSHTTTAQKRAYLELLLQFLTDGALNTTFDRLVSGDSYSPETAATVSALLTKYKSSFESSVIPQEFSAIDLSNKKLVAGLQEIVADLGRAQTTNDPLKELVVIQSHQELVQLAVEDLTNEVEKLPDNIVMTSGDTIRKFLGIKTAHAGILGGLIGTTVGCGVATLAGKLISFLIGKLGLEVPVTDTTKDVADFVKCLQKAYLETLKKLLTDQIINQTIAWVQGGGKPQFVRNWKSLLDDAGSIAAGSVIESIAPGFCRSFGPQLRLQLEYVYKASPPALSCTLDQVVQNTKLFFDDFKQGGWAGFGALASPSGNFFGQLFEGSQIIELNQLSEQASAKSRQESAKGFLDTEKCVDQKYNGNDCIQQYNASCAEQYPDLGDAYDDCRFPYIEGCYIKFPQNASSSYTCTRKEITTPGGTVAASLDKALGGKLDQIVNVQSIEGLINALVNAAITKLSNAARNALFPHRGEGIAGLRVSTTTIGTDPTKSPCYPTRNSPTEFAQCINGLAGVCSDLKKDQSNSCIDIMCGGFSGTQRTQCEAAVKTGQVAPDDGGGGGGGGEGQNCPANCLCKGRDFNGSTELTHANMCFRDLVAQAQDAVIQEARQNGYGTVGLDEGKCPGAGCVVNDVLYAEKIRGYVLQFGGSAVSKVEIREEIGVTGTCAKTSYSATRPGVSVSSPRYEGVATVATGGSLRNAVGISMCPAE